MHGLCCTLCSVVMYIAVSLLVSNVQPISPKSVKKAKHVDRRYNLLHLSLVVFSSREWVSILEPNGFASSQFLLCKQDPAMFELVVLRFPVCQTMIPTFQATT
jgi:hypothetical protein